MAKERRSRSDRSQVQSVLNLLNSTRRVKRGGVRNPTRKLTAQQYEQFLTALRDPRDHSIPAEVKDSLRFEYSNSNNRFEIRLSNVIDTGIQSFFEEAIRTWREYLQKSSHARISSLIETLTSAPGGSLIFSDDSGAKEAKSPNWEIRHKCARGGDRQCRYPALVLEIGWTQTKADLQEKAEVYINSSKGEIRTVVAVNMYGMYLAERKNEDTLRRMYRKGDMKQNRSYSFSKDNNNQTASASILVWRAGTDAGGVIKIGDPEEKIFRDPQGTAIQSESLHLPFHDFLCTGLNDFQGELEEPLFEISSDTLCKAIKETLEKYREERAVVVRETVKQEAQKSLERIEKEMSSNGRIKK
ncbi:hypothetical protein F5Y10DRAFT_270039 [Nemania abortiva]|nr:hypothetical protein F5Y10DRAFT_270039 [Nemania abortiva]